MELTLEQYWQQVCAHVAEAPRQMPQAWAFGANADQADELLDLVVRGIKTATSSLAREYSPAEPMPEVGEWSVILDGTGRPRATLCTTAVQVLRFDQVDDSHAHAEGEGDRTLATWRSIHDQFWGGVNPDELVVCENFMVAHPPRPMSRPVAVPN